MNKEEKNNGIILLKKKVGRRGYKMTMKTSGKVFLVIIIALTIPFLKYTKFGDLIALLVLIGICIFNKKI
ncbi:hypothetical protein CN514_19735, partial [Bacillus sp. AFS001701]